MSKEARDNRDGRSVKPRLVGYKDNRTLVERVLDAITSDGSSPLNRAVTWGLGLVVAALGLLVAVRWPW